MKIRILDRILVAVAGLLILAGCAAVAAQLFFGTNVLDSILRRIQSDQARLLVIIGLCILIVIGGYCVLILFRHRGKRDKFILQRMESGELAISLKAMESMVQKCLSSHKELSIQGIRLENQKGGLMIRIRGTAAGGVSIPLTVDALQQQIKQYVTACSGVEVRNIKVQIESSGPDAKDAPFAIEAPAAQVLLNGGQKSEKTAEDEKKDENGELTEEAMEDLLAGVPAPAPSDAEDSGAVTVSAAAAAAAELLMNEAPQEEDNRPIHQRLFSSEDKPCVMPMPPETITEMKYEKTEEVQAAPESGELKQEEPDEKPAVTETGGDESEEGGKV